MQEDESTDGVCPVDGQNRKKDIITLDHDDLEHLSGSLDGITPMSYVNEVTPSKQPLSCFSDDVATKSNDEIYASYQPLQHLRGKQNAAKNIVDDNSDDDLIPPTPSPLGLSHSFMKSATSSEDGTPKRHTFTNLKLTQVIRKKEEQERKKLMIKLRYGLVDEGSSSMTNASAFANKLGATAEDSFSTDNKKRNLKVNANNNGGKHRLNSDNCTLKIIGSKHLNVGNRICASPEISGEKTKSPLTTSSDATSLSIDDKAQPVLAPKKFVLKKGKSFKRRASKGNSPTNKRHQGELPILIQVSLCKSLQVLSAIKQP